MCIVCVIEVEYLKGIHRRISSLIALWFKLMYRKELIAVICSVHDVHITGRIWLLKISSVLVSIQDSHITHSPILLRWIIQACPMSVARRVTYFTIESCKSRQFDSFNWVRHTYNWHERLKSNRRNETRRTVLQCLLYASISHGKKGWPWIMRMAADASVFIHVYCKYIIASFRWPMAVTAHLLCRRSSRCFKITECNDRRWGEWSVINQICLNWAILWTF